MRIFAALALDAGQSARLREIAAGDELHLGSADGAPPPELAASEVVFGNLPAAWLAAAPALKWMQLESVGFGEYLGAPEAAAIRLTNLAGFFGEPVAETALAGIFAHYRGIDRLVRLQTAQDWQGGPLRAGLRTLAGARVVIFGHGAIGRRLAELLAPFGCAVTGFGRGWTAEALDRALAGTDVFVGAAPDTSGTRDVLDRRRLTLLPAHTLVVNVGRGSLIDEDALADALDAGRLGGAVLDVTRDEPLPPGHRLWTCPGVLLTQHSGGGTADEVDRKIDWFAANLARYRAGEPLVGLVDLQRGY
jgi:phosphoglycerate dehydrogenase-like enzyme